MEDFSIIYNRYHENKPTPNLHGSLLFLVSCKSSILTVYDLHLRAMIHLQHVVNSSDILEANLTLLDLNISYGKRGRPLVDDFLEKYLFKVMLFIRYGRFQINIMHVRFNQH